MNDLVDFLRARLAEDEEAARTASPSPWKDPEEDEADDLWLTREDAYHIYRWEPARVLREVEAKRAIIQDFEVTSDGIDMDSCDVDHDADRALVSSLRGVLKALASVYADHPDYREEWRI